MNNSKPKIDLLPINLRNFSSNDFILKSNNINSLCQNNLFEIKQINERKKLTTNEILQSLDNILFPDAKILEITMDLYNLTIPNILTLVIYCLILNKKISPRTNKLLCDIKKSKTEKEMFKLVSRIPYKEFYKFLQKFLCAVKYHLDNINKKYEENKNNKKQESDVVFLIDFIKKNNGNIENFLVLDTKSNRKILQLGITTVIYFGYLLNNIFYERYINKKPDPDKMRDLMNNDKLLKKNGKISIKDSFLFCVYTYDVFNYIVSEILLANLYKNINRQKNIPPKLFIEDFEYNAQIINKNIIFKHIIEMEEKYFKLYKDISIKELYKMNLDKFVLDGDTLKRQLKRSYLDDRLFKLTNEELKIIDTNQNNNNKTGDYSIQLIDGRIVFSSNKNSFLQCYGKNNKCKTYDIGFDGKYIFKFVNGEPVCSMGYIEQDKKDKYKFSIYFNRPVLKNKVLKIADIHLQTTYKKVEIKFTSIYLFIELIIVTFISFKILNDGLNTYKENGKKLPECVHRRLTKELNFINCF